MNTEEQTLIDGLFTRLRQAEDPQQPRDAQAQSRIEEHVRQQPAAPYYMAQAILVQEAALKRLNEQNKQLEQELKQLREQSASRPSTGGGFLSGLFGGGQSERSATSQAPAPRPASAPTNAGGWRDSGPQNPAPSAPQQAAPQPSAPFGGAARGGAGSFLGGAMQTAAGVAGGVLLAQGISSLFNHHNPQQEVVDVIREEPAPASDTGGWNDSGAQQQVADDGNWQQDSGGFADTDYDQGGDLFSDDDSFI